MYLATQISDVDQPVWDVLVSLKVPIFLCESIVYYIYLPQKPVSSAIIGPRDINSREDAFPGIEHIASYTGKVIYQRTE